MLRRIDAWVGKTLFIPIIIKVCQKLKLTQHAFANYASIGALLWWLACVPPDGWGMWLLWGIMAFMAFVEIVVYSHLPDLPQHPSFGFRIWAMGFLVLESLLVHPLAVFWLLWVFKEFAREIDTIPPEEQKEREKQVALAPAKVKS